MNEKPFEFSEGAILYAKNKAVVDEMYRIFTSDISNFVDLLRDRVKARVTSGRFDENGKANRVWYIWDDSGENSEEQDVPYLWFPTESAEIVSQGIIRFEVLANGDLRPHRASLVSLLSGLQLDGNAKITSVGAGQTLFKVEIQCGTDDPVGTATEPVHALLVALFEASKQLRASLAKGQSKLTMRE